VRWPAGSLAVRMGLALGVVGIVAAVTSGASPGTGGAPQRPRAAGSAAGEAAAEAAGARAAGAGLAAEAAGARAAGAGPAAGAGAGLAAGAVPLVRAPAHDHAATRAPATVADGSHQGHATVPTGGEGALDEAAASRLVAATTASVRRWDTLASAQAAGYRVVTDSGGLVHVLRPALVLDGRTLDPAAPEALVYLRGMGGRTLLLGAMYVLAPGQRAPAVAGARWHVHRDLCIDLGGLARAPRDPTGRCRATLLRETPPMLHVWALAYPGGPFADTGPAALQEVAREHGLTLTG